MKAITVARYFIYLSYQDKDQMSITPLKLQKLLYYAQGYSYNWDRDKLFTDEIEAYNSGPVVREVYIILNKYGQSEIPKSEGKDIVTTKERKETIQGVWMGYKRMSGIELAARSKTEEPCMNCLTNNERIIKKEVIQEYFKKAYS